MSLLTVGMKGKRRFLFDSSLALYLPLWHPELKDSTIISKDLNAHSCTVTDATWGIQGRTLDGVDDKISCPDSPVYDLTSNILTIIGWVNPTSDTTAYAGLVSNQDTDKVGGFLLDRNNESTTQYRFAYGRTTGWNIALRVGGGDYALTLTNGVWQQFAITWSGAVVLGYINGSLQNTCSIGTQAFTNGDKTMNIGSSPIAGRPWKGIFGEVLIYKSLFSASAVSNYCQVTKWRYS